MSLTRLRHGSVAASAIEYASVTEQVALKVARLEGYGTPEKAYTLATEVFREELGEMPVSGQVAILREERRDERGQMRPLKTRPGTVVMSTEPRMVRFIDTIHALEPDAGTQGFQL
jgi:fructose-1,6-bisphosphatase/sedoheptulose 1,7-bisphosphatase-like protein